MYKYVKGNLKHWNEITPIHQRSDLYQLEEFKSGKMKTALKPIELEEMGDVKGKSLLHLQCHFGMDTLSWARLGAKVTGIDFSDKAIAYARALSKEMDIPARFIQTDIYDLPDVLKGKFDIVFTSYGVLCWLPDLNRWAQIIAHYLKRGGCFYIIEGHPIMTIFDNSKNAKGFNVTESYFHSTNPIRWEAEGDYTDRNAEVKNPSFEWTHPMSEIMNCLINVGLRIEYLHEFAKATGQWSPFTVQEPDGYWHTPGDKVPLIFSLKAAKPR
jgi:SAM-dependent methyltransferase